MLRFSGCAGGERNANKILNEGHRGKQSLGRDRRRDTNSEKGYFEGWRYVKFVPDRIVLRFSTCKITMVVRKEL
jgi:hypothetical protein